MLYNTNQTVNTLTEYYSDNESGYESIIQIMKADMAVISQSE